MGKLSAVFEAMLGGKEKLKFSGIDRIANNNSSRLCAVAASGPWGQLLQDAGSTL